MYRSHPACALPMSPMPTVLTINPGPPHRQNRVIRCISWWLICPCLYRWLMATLPAGYPPTRLSRMAGAQHPGRANRRRVMACIQRPGCWHRGESANHPANSINGNRVGIMTVQHIDRPRLMPVCTASGYCNKSAVKAMNRAASKAFCHVWRRMIRTYIRISPFGHSMIGSARLCRYF